MELRYPLVEPFSSPSFSKCYLMELHPQMFIKHKIYRRNCINENKLRNALYNKRPNSLGSFQYFGHLSEVLVSNC